MSEVRSFPIEDQSVGELVVVLREWLGREGFNSQTLQSEDGATVIQVSKQGGWRKLVGMSTALNVVLRNNSSSLLVEIGAGRWIDKASVATVSLFILWPLAVTSAIGAWQQMKMPERILEQIQRFSDQPRKLLVTLDNEPKRVRAAVEKVQAPAGVTVKVTRSRTIEHTLSIRWEASLQTSVETGDKELFRKSIHRKIEEEKGRSYKETESVEYEVALDGSLSQQYALVWFDSWCTGTVSFQRSSGIMTVPFEFRDQTQLEVISGWDSLDTPAAALQDQANY